MSTCFRRGGTSKRLASARGVPIALHRTTSHNFQALGGGVTSSDLGMIWSDKTVMRGNFAVETLLGARRLAS